MALQARGSDLSREDESQARVTALTGCTRGFTV